MLLALLIQDWRLDIRRNDPSTFKGSQGCQFIKKININFLIKMMNFNKNYRFQNKKIIIFSSLFLEKKEDDNIKN